MQIPIISGIATTTLVGTCTMRDNGDINMRMNPIATSLTSTGTTALAKGYREINIDLANNYIESLSDQELAQLDQMLNNKEYIEIEEYHKHI